MTENLLVLHIDDDALFRRMMRRALERKSCTVIEAEHGEEGMRRAIADQPALILLDIRMPIQDGFETLRLLQEQEETQHIPVVMCSSLGAKEDVAFCFARGASGYAIKGHQHPEEVVSYLLSFRDTLPL